MSNKLNRALVCVSVMQLISVTMVLQSQARDLTDVLIRGFSFNAGGKDSSASAKAVAPAFSAALAQAVARVPVASGAPSFIYRLNPIVDTYERLTSLPGPLFSERALTLGKGRFDFNIGYSFIDFSELNGTDLDNIRSPAFVADIIADKRIPVDPSLIGLELEPGEELFEAPFSGSPIRTRIDLHAHLIVPTLRYGVTDDWELSLSAPIVNTFLRVRNEVVRIVDLDPASSARLWFVRDARGNDITLGFFDPAGNFLPNSQIPFIKSQRRSELVRKAAGNATGIGDITFRSKYQFWQNGLGGGAFGLNLQVPTGEEENFHGSGETHLTTFLYFSQVLWKRFEPRLNIGIDLNVEDVDRSSFLYTAGWTFLIGEKLGLIVDFIGRSEFGELRVRVPDEGIYQGFVVDRDPDTCTHERPCFIDLNKNPKFPFFSAHIHRNNTADFSFAIRYGLGTSSSLFLGGIVPINDGGFRADFIPSGGIEYAF